MEKIIVLIFVILASICDAIADTCTHHYYRSIFTRFKEQYWNPEISWKNKYINWDKGDRRRKKLFGIKLHVAFTDSWHLLKSIKLVLLLSSIVIYPNSNNILLDILLIGTIWNLTFSLFYDKILIKK